MDLLKNRPDERVREAATPTEMRAEIYRLQRESPIVRMVMDTADYNGLSAEDRYTLLAYHALKDRAKYQELALEQIALSPRQTMMAKE